jgi:hypothetical protein
VPNLLLGLLGSTSLPGLPGGVLWKVAGGDFDLDVDVFSVVGVLGGEPPPTVASFVCWPPLPGLLASLPFVDRFLLRLGMLVILLIILLSPVVTMRQDNRGISLFELLLNCLNY